MLSRIPSWAVAVVGASIVIVATATSSTLLHQTPSPALYPHRMLDKGSPLVSHDAT